MYIFLVLFNDGQHSFLCLIQGRAEAASSLESGQFDFHYRREKNLSHLSRRTARDSVGYRLVFCVL